MGSPAAEDPDPHDRPDRLLLLLRGAVAIALAGLLTAALLAPVAIGAGTLLARAATGVGATTAGVLDRAPDAVTVVTDATGRPMALLYRRFRVPVGRSGVSGRDRRRPAAGPW
ncbi:hypothetical protein [Actinomycetospora straminea]|uniref:Sensor histidine kinase n=1 Tax=Actinomycetospora straminea TaxID=663607 RepID=A0ABP9EIP3_9PSEU|nr:hypothetical protein [Actinomycetospora straminea]MDD7933139.1 hypothetical protein [Actinomycetospora straminea]